MQLKNGSVSLNLQHRYC